MKKMIYLVMLITVPAIYQLCLADVPYQIGGFRLGANVNQYAESLRMEASLPLRHMEYLSEVEVKPFNGFRSGYISYGNCYNSGQVVKIKLKYERSDRGFFDELLEHFSKKFGKPDEYKGDAFRAFIAWKWSFTDKNKNKISLILQHNSQDDEEYTSGNSVKMSQVTLMEQERKCYEKKHPEVREESLEAQKEPSQKRPDFKLLVPE